MAEKEEYQSLLETYKQHVGFDKFNDGEQLQFWTDVKMCSNERIEYDINGLKKLIDTMHPQEVFDEIVKEYKKKIKDPVKKEEIRLPKSGRLISDFANDIVDILSEQKTIFFRTDTLQVVEVGDIEHNEDNKFFIGFIIVKPSRFVTLVEKYFTPGNIIKIGDDSFVFKSKSMTKDLATTLLDSKILESALLNINRIFTIPMPIMYDNELTFPTVGYDDRFNSWLPRNAPKITNTKMSLKESKEIIDNILKEFCFKDDTDVNMAIAGLITPFLKGLYHSFNCRTPVFIYLANRERIGKDYLAGINGMLYEGIALEEPPISVPRDKGNVGEELRKKILSAFISGRKRLHFANNKGYINNAIFEGIITAPTFSDRVLGRNELLTFDNELEFSLSGNIGIGFTPDLANRSRIITQFFSEEDPNKREFENPDLHKWVLDNRDLILSAIYGLVRNWVDKGYPDGKKPFASFPEWARVCGGIMESAGYKSPCEPNKDVTLGGDTETTDMTQLYEFMFENYPNDPKKSSEIRELIKEENLFSYFDFNEKSDQTKFGNMIIRFAGRILSDISMKVVDDSVKRKSNRKYIFSKEISTYTKEKPKKDVTYCNPCNIQATKDYKIKKRNKGVGGVTQVALGYKPEVTEEDVL